MSFNQGSIFKARQSRPASTVPTDSSISNESLTGSNKTAFELTKNKKYCVSRLPALPSVLDKSQSDSILNGYSDYASNYSLVINEHAIHVWSYKSTDPAPLSIQFPLDTQSSPLLPLALLTKPSSGTSQDPGLVIIDSSKGLVKFYASVQHAPALGLINNKLLELSLPINHKKGEYITLAENVEPAGIVVATSWKRCVLISLRDFKSKPRLSTIELLSPSQSSSIFSSVLDRFAGKSDDDKVKDEIVSIKSGKIINHGMTQEIIIQDSVGGFNLFTYQLLSANGVPYLDKKKSYKQNLTPYFENNIEGFLPGSSLNIKFLDLWPLASQEHENIYLGLCCIDEPFSDFDGNSLYLITVKIDNTGVLLYGSHKLTSYDSVSNISSNNKPKLFIPAPGKTAFITIDNSIILTDINTSYIQTQNTVQYYKPRWEDIVKLKSSVRVIGQGYEDQASNSNPSVILITSNSGVLRVERFPELNENDMEIDEDIMGPINIVKSHIEQAIFYANSSAIEFDINADFSDNVIIEAIQKILNEILDSSSPYLPLFLPSINDFLSMKLQLYDALICYTKRNFKTLCFKIVPQIVEYLEKIDVALKLWIHINDEPSITEKLNNILENVIRDSKLVQDNGSEDLVRKFFCQGVASINQVLTEFIERLVSANFSLTNLINLIVKTMYCGVYKNELKYISNDNEVPITKLWIFDTSLLIRVEDVFSKEYCDDNDDQYIVTQQRRINLVKLCEVLYYFVTCAIRYMQEHESYSDQLKEYLRWYSARKYYWMNALLMQNLEDEAVKVSERYYDLSSLAQIMETERAKILEKYGEDSEEFKNLANKYSYYFEKFKYDFASSLYEYYSKNDKVQPLLLGFQDYKNYLNQYLYENPKKTSDIAWIRYLLDEKFNEASRALICSANLNNDENLDNRELKYSLAKLSAIATKNSNIKIDSDLINEQLMESENNLIKIRTQNTLCQSLLEYVSGQKELLNLEYVLKNFVNDSIDYATCKEIIGPSFQHFIANKPLAPVELINLLTFIKPSASFAKGFAKALEISSLFSNEKIFKYQTKVIWLRLLTTTDDWSVLAKTKNKTDQYIKQKIHGTILFKTLSLIGTNDELLNELDEFLNNTSSCFTDEDEDNLTIKSLNELLLEKLSIYTNEVDLSSWITSIKQEVKNSVSK